MITVDHAAQLSEQTRLFGELIAVSDPTTAVPTCPDWTLTQLGTHLGRGHRWAATIVAHRSQVSVDPRTVEDGKPPPDPTQVPGWLDHGVTLLLDAVSTTGPDTMVWTFIGPRPASWWVRRRLHEATVHRADAALAIGDPYLLSPAVAADGIAEWLTMLAARSSDPPPLAAGETLHLHATDDNLGEAGEWLVRSDGTTIAWDNGHARATVAVAGNATNLHLMLMRRLANDDPELEVHGAAVVLDTWLARTPF